MATPFSVFGKGNGFSYCLEKVDVSDYDLVVPMTYSEAMSVYYNLESVKITFSGMEDYTSPWVFPVLDKTVFESFLPGDPYGQSDIDAAIAAEEAVALVPSLRSCSTPRGIIVSGLISGDSGISRVKKLYNGPTDDEDNFVGYGFTDGPDAFAEQDKGVSLSSAVSLDGGLGLFNLIEAIGQYDIPVTGAGGTVPFACYTSGKGSTNGDGIGEVADVLSPTSGSVSGSDGSIQIESLEFYTY